MCLLDADSKLRLQPPTRLMGLLQQHAEAKVYAKVHAHVKDVYDCIM